MATKTWPLFFFVSSSKANRRVRRSPPRKARILLSAASFSPCLKAFRDLVLKISLQSARHELRDDEPSVEITLKRVVDFARQFEFCREFARLRFVGYCVATVGGLDRRHHLIGDLVAGIAFMIGPGKTAQRRRRRGFRSSRIGLAAGEGNAVATTSSLPLRLRRSSKPTQSAIGFGERHAMNTSSLLTNASIFKDMLKVL